ncbi:MAG: hypothetical protein ACXWSC_22085, partial [Bdellovibrionota bacterium]
GESKGPEADGSEVGTIWVKVKDPKQMAAISQQIDAMFKNSDFPTETFTEKLEQVTAMIRSELMLQNLPSGKFAATSSARLVQEFLN